MGRAPAAVCFAVRILLWIHGRSAPHSYGARLAGWRGVREYKCPPHHYTVASAAFFRSAITSRSMLGGKRL